jgi:Putative beta-barrel porin 2
MLLWSVGASAEITISGEAAPQYEYNSNVFFLPGGAAAPGTTNTNHADSSISYRGLLRSAYTLDDQTLYANVSGADIRYNRLTELTHFEYSFDGGLRWTFSRALSGSLEVTRTRTQLAFSDLLNAQSELALETEQRETATVRYLVNPDWRLDAIVYNHRIDVPLPQFADLNLEGTAGSMSLSYIQGAALTVGGSVGYESGHYQGGVDGVAPTYRQVSAGVVSTYAATGLSSFTGQVGYTRRTSSTNFNNLSGATGSLNYSRKLTGKTSVSVAVNRVINNTITNAGSEIDTGASASIQWQTTYRLLVNLSGGYTIRFLPSQGVFPTVDRTDHETEASLSLVYKATRWLDVQPYATIKNRNSESYLNHYNATIIGIKVVGRFGAAPTASAPNPAGLMPTNTR